MENTDIIRMLKRLKELQCFKGDRMPIKDKWVNDIFKDCQEMIEELERES